MTTRAGSKRRTGTLPLLPWALAAALLAGVLVAWSPRYWPTTVCMAGISLVAIWWTAAGREVAMPRQMLLAIPIGAWGWLQLLFHLTVIPALTMRNALVWTMGAVVFFLASQILASRQNLLPFLNAMLVALTTVAAIAMLQATSQPVRVFGIFEAAPSVVGTMFYKNHFAALMELAAPLALWKMLEGRVLAGSLCYAAILGATITSLSRAGTILVLAELVVFLAIVIAGRRMPLKSAVIVGAILLISTLGGVLVAGPEALWERMQEPNAYHLREQLALSTFSMIGEHPLRGTGMGTWRAVYPHFARYDDGLLANEAHNDLAQWASDGGIPFLMLMLGLAGWLAVPAVRSVWGLGILAVILHCYVDYALRAPSLTFLWLAIAGALTTDRSGRGRAARGNSNL